MKVHMTTRAKRLLTEGLAEARRGMEEQAEPEGGDICNEYSDEIEAYEAAIQTHKNRNNNGLSPFNNMSYDEATRR